MHINGLLCDCVCVCVCECVSGRGVVFHFKVCAGHVMQSMEK